MKRVLVVDDGAFMRTLIKGMLLKHGYEVVGEAEDGLQGVEKYNALKPDLVTMDITMPNMDGIEALRNIMQVDPEACVVMVSAMGQEVYIKEAIRLGARSFVVKPFDEATLFSVLEGV
jgi:Response regulator containing CheY-like receiver domain and AraC-type DNA-binding domain